MEYKLSEVNAENVQDSKIEKTGHKIYFSMSEVEAHEKKLGKVLVELEAQVKLEEAKVENIKEHHPYVLDLDDEKLFAVSMYQECKNNVKMGTEKVEEIKKQLQEYADEKAEIVKQIPELAPQKITIEFVDKRGEEEVVTTTEVEIAPEPVVVDIQALDESIAEDKHNEETN